MRTSTTVDGWVVRATSGPVPARLDHVEVAATVPGTVHTDLLDAGLIPDPYVDEGERELAWMRRASWRYSTRVRLEPPGPDERVDLVFAGIDTVATVELGGEVVARTANMHRSHRVDVRAAAAVAAGDPLPLTVDLSSALEHAEAEQDRIGFRPGAYPQPFNMVRKMACSFGWDWGPDLQTAGLWQPVTVERWRVARIAAVRPLVSVAGDHSTATVSVHLDVERSGIGSAPAELAVVVSLGGRRATGRVAADRSGAVVEVVVDHPVLWWPRGHGEAVLHDLAVELLDTDGGVLDTWARRIGLRSVALDTTPDEHGTPFTLAVNGRPVFVKGANWIPDDHLLTRITRERLARRVDQAVGAGLNLLRVWGGGIYESEHFYELCDEAGLMVWQDFLLACAAYPEEEPHLAELEAEAREQVTRLSCHPSLVLWNGGNENLWGFVDWGWQEQLEGRTWGWRYYTEVFPRVLAELDPTRPYAAGLALLTRARADRGAPQRPRPRHAPRVGGVEPRRLHGLPRCRSPVLLRVRLPGAADVGHPAAGGPGRRRAGRDQGPPDLPAAPEGRRRQRQARPWAGPAPRRADRLRRLALGHPAQPGPGGGPRAHPLPLVVAAHRGRDRVAAQRLLAGDVVGRGRRRRATQAAVVGAAGVLRRPAAHGAASTRTRRGR